MRWFVVLSLVVDALATAVVPVGFGSLHARRSKRNLGRRVDGICKPRPSKFPVSTSITVLPSTTSSRPQPTPTTTRSVSPSSVPVQGIAAKVLPLGFGSSANSWTTVPNASKEYYALTDTGSTLRPTRILGGSLAAVGTAPDGRAAMEVFFAKGSYAFTPGVAGGISFYAYGPSDLSSGNEFTLGYSIFFESGFDFVRGGKLPGLYGGTSNDEAASCSGGRHVQTCFSTRFMWRELGAAELYVYLPSDPANNFLCNGARIPGRNICGSDYGTSLGRGSFSFKAGQWNHVAQRIKLNTPGKADGELQASTNPAMDHGVLSSSLSLYATRGSYLHVI